jgi:ATP-dependent Clp protease ATP-binding subunit ClpA
VGRHLLDGSIPKSVFGRRHEISEAYPAVQVFERFTDRARRVVVLAQEEARMLNHNYIGTEHILLGLVRERDGVAAKALDGLNIRLDAVRREVEEVIGQGQAAPTGHIPFTPRAKKVLELSLREALQLGHNYIGTEHILLGLIREGEGVAAQVLQKLGADLDRVRQTVIQLLSGYTAGAEIRKVGGGAEMEEELATEIAPTPVPAAEDAPTCPNCFAALDEHLAVRELATMAGGESLSVKIAYCSRCGVALGAVT